MTFDAHAVTYTDIIRLRRNDMLAAVEHQPVLKKRLRLLGIKRLFHDEVMAYCRAVAALETGVTARAADIFGVDQRSLHYYAKLVALYGADGRGLWDRNWTLEGKPQKRIEAAKAGSPWSACERAGGLQRPQRASRCPAQVIQRAGRSYIARRRFKKLIASAILMAKSGSLATLGSVHYKPEKRKPAASKVPTRLSECT